MPRPPLRSLRARARSLRAAAGPSPAPSLPAPADPPVPIDYERLEALMRQVASDVYQEQWSMAHQLRSLSAEASARFVLEHIPLHLGKTHYDLRRDAVLAAPAGGLFLEFGVWQGNWLRHMAAVRDVPFFGFDSFEGLPEPWSVYEAGTFDLGGSLPEIPSNVELIKGWFHETLPAFLTAHSGPVSFIHLDCDLYTSSKTVLDLLEPRIVEGTQIVLDDFMLEPGWEQEEHRAFFEFIERGGWRFEYTGYSRDSPGCSAGVRLLGRG